MERTQLPACEGSETVVKQDVRLAGLRSQASSLGTRRHGLPDQELESDREAEAAAVAMEATAMGTVIVMGVPRVHGNRGGNDHGRPQVVGRRPVVMPVVTMVVATVISPRARMVA